MKKNNISAVMVIYNEENKIKRCLESIKGVVDEIIVVHDGPCKDKTIEICKKYTKKIIVNKNNVGLPGPILPSLIKRAKGPWILKIDADEYLSLKLKRDIKKLVLNPKADAYTFKWLYRAKGKYITKNWPTKTALYRKSKSSFLGLPHWDDPRMSGNIIKTNYSLEHRPSREGMPTWKEYQDKVLKRYMVVQAKYTLKDFKELDKFQWKEKDFPKAIRIRRDFPLLSATPMAITGFFKSLLTDNAWKEGYPAFWQAFSVVIYYHCLGYYLHKLKRLKGKQNVA